MLKLEDIVEIRKRPRTHPEPGYEIVFNDGRIIWLTKSRTIIALLILIKYEEGSESDLASGSVKIPEIKRILGGKYPENLIKDFYGDANKPLVNFGMKKVLFGLKILQANVKTVVKAMY